MTDPSPQGLDQEALARLIDGFETEIKKYGQFGCGWTQDIADAKRAIIAHVSPLLVERDRELAACRGREEGKQLVINQLEAAAATRDARIKALEEGFNYVCGLLPSARLAMEREPDNYVLSCMVNVGELRKVRSFRALLNPSTVEGKEDV